jgi:hypothetical protein
VLGRLKFNLGNFPDLMIDEIAEYLDSDKKFCDIAMAGGQLVKAIEERVADKSRVSGYEETLLGVRFAVNDKKLQGNYSVENMLEESKMFDFKNTIVVGNPPYNDGTAARNPIYQKFLKKLVQGDPDHVVFIIPTNWFSQDNNKLGKEVREHLRNLGLYKIWINPVDLFENVTVGTCTVFCKKGYVGKIELLDKMTQKSVFIQDFSQQILHELDNVTLTMLDRLKPNKPFKTYSGKQGDTSKYRIVTSYRKERFDIEPLNVLKVLPPEYKNQGGYRVFEECDTEEQANERVEELKSFWHSKIIKTIMRKTRTSTTLDNPQLRWVPVIDINKTFTDEELYKLFECTPEEVEVIENDNR